MTNRLTLALAVGKLVVKNLESTSVAVTLVKTVDGKTSSYVYVLKPGRIVDLTRKCSPKELRQSPDLSTAVSRYKIDVLDTWTAKPVEEPVPVPKQPRVKPVTQEQKGQPSSPASPAIVVVSETTDPGDVIMIHDYHEADDKKPTKKKK